VTSWTAGLDALPRLSLVTDPTPLAPAFRLPAALGGPQLWFKRDDLLPFAFGGNKVRSLDLIVAEALRRGADTQTLWLPAPVPSRTTYGPVAEWRP
jgi:1-aminocyclopropane-1-carboxylate deaminase/D-cysteine desulfhydrase-like pyridoxal-dependent ACC family enzyme